MDENRKEYGQSATGAIAREETGMTSCCASADSADGGSETQEEGSCGCCCGKKTVRTIEERRKLINRLKRIEGQIRGIIGMLENDTYCNDILIQSAAVNAAMNAFNRELLESHLRSCVVRDIREGHDETVDELVEILKKLMK